MSETLKFLCRQFFFTPTKVNPQKSNLCGQTGIVTGSNIGLGLEASRQLLELGLSRVGRFQRAKGNPNFLCFQQRQVLRHARSILHLQALARDRPDRTMLYRSEFKENRQRRQFRFLLRFGTAHRSDDPIPRSRNHFYFR